MRIEKNTTITCEDGMYGKSQIDIFGFYDECIYLKNKAVLTFKDARASISFSSAISSSVTIRGEGKEYVHVDHSYLQVYSGKGTCIKKLSYFDIKNSCLALNGAKCVENAECVQGAGCKIISDYNSVNFKDGTIYIDGKVATEITFDNPMSIDSDKFPDDNFRSYVKNMKGVWNGQLTTELMADYLKIYLKHLGIKSLKGIEYFKGLRVLDCSYNQLTSLDLSNNKRLEEIDASSNRINNDEMTRFVNSLPKAESENCKLTVVTGDGERDGNICTSSHVKVIEKKNWIPYKLEDYAIHTRYDGYKDYKIKVGEEWLTNTNFNKIMSFKGVKGSADFDPYSFILTLENTSITGEVRNNSKTLLTIYSHKISTIDSISAYKLEIMGDGTLNVKRQIENCKELMLIDDIKVDVNTTNNPIGIFPYYNRDAREFEPTKIRILNDAILKVHGKQRAIYAVKGSELILKDNAEIRIPENARWNTTDNNFATFVSLTDNKPLDQTLVQIGANEKVNDINISDLTMPKDFEHGDYEATTKTEGCKLGNIVYKNHKTGKIIDAKTQYFTGGDEVEIHVTMKADAGYEFTKTTKCLLNNKKQDAITFDSKATDFCYLYTVPVPEDGISIQKFTATITAPKAGEKPQLTINNLDAKHLKIIGVYWNDMDENNLVVKQMYRTYVNGEYRVSNENETFEAGHKYMLMIKLEPADGYIFHEKTSYVINGNEKDIKISWAPHRANLTYTFPKLPEDKTTGIETVSADEDGKWYNLNGTELSGKPSKGGIYIFNGHKVVVNK